MELIKGGWNGAHKRGNYERVERGKQVAIWPPVVIV